MCECACVCVCVCACVRTGVCACAASLSVPLSVEGRTRTCHARSSWRTRRRSLDTSRTDPPHMGRSEAPHDRHGTRTVRSRTDRARCLRRRRHSSTRWSAGCRTDPPSCPCRCTTRPFRNTWADRNNCCHKPFSLDNTLLKCPRNSDYPCSRKNKMSKDTRET